jgi:hypothetical protein
MPGRFPQAVARAAPKAVADCRKRVTPETAAETGAVGYYFARRLHETIPAFLEGVYGEVDGLVWYRKAFDLPAGLAGKPLTFRLGVVDDGGAAYFNGGKPGSTSPDDVTDSWDFKRVYAVPGPFVKIYHQGAVFYHAMCAPLRGFPFTASLWYQGERDAGRIHPLNKQEVGRRLALTWNGSGLYGPTAPANPRLSRRRGARRRRRCRPRRCNGARRAPAPSGAGRRGRPSVPSRPAARRPRRDR